MKTPNRHAKAQPATWAFRAKFRRDAFGWRGSRLAIERINEALAEIRAVRQRPGLCRAGSRAVAGAAFAGVVEGGRVRIRRAGQRDLRRRPYAGAHHCKRAGRRARTRHGSELLGPRPAERRQSSLRGRHGTNWMVRRVFRTERHGGDALDGSRERARADSVARQGLIATVSCLNCWPDSSANLAARHAPQPQVPQVHAESIVAGGLCGKRGPTRYRRTGYRIPECPCPRSRRWRRHLGGETAMGHLPLPDAFLAAPGGGNGPAQFHRYARSDARRMLPAVHQPGARQLAGSPMRRLTTSCMLRVLWTNHWSRSIV